MNQGCGRSHWSFLVCLARDSIQGEPHSTQTVYFYYSVDKWTRISRAGPVFNFTTRWFTCLCGWTRNDTPRCQTLQSKGGVSVIMTSWNLKNPASEAVSWEKLGIFHLQNFKKKKNDEICCTYNLYIRMYTTKKSREKNFITLHPGPSQHAVNSRLQVKIFH